MIEKMDRLKRTVLELIVGIAAFGVLFEILGILFVKDKGAYTIGIVCGALTAAGIAIHMAYHLNNALDWDEENARRMIRKGTAIRYAAVTLVIILLAYFKIGNIFSYFLGIMTLKAAAYAQPYVHRLLNKIFHIEEGGAEYGFHDSRID